MRSCGRALRLPVGPGGFAPKVTLSYSSGMVNGMVGAKNSDGGWVGMGWTLDLGHLTEKRLSLNGVSGDLKLGKDGFYYLEEDPSLRIRRIDGRNKESHRWEVSDRSGTVYHFGRSPDGGGSVVLFRHPWSRERCALKIVAYKLYQVVDAGGNTLDITYNEMLNTGPCGPEQLVRESYPHQLRYTTNPSANDHHAEYVVEFELEDKGYSAAHEDAHGDIHYRLRRIHIWHDDPTHGRQHIRTLRFGYHTSVPEKHSLLTSLTVSSGPGEEAPTLPGLVFAYRSHQVGSVGSGTFDRPFLAAVHNGYGGEVQFTYATEKYERQTLFQVVTKRTVVEAVGQLTTEQHYHYHERHIKLNSRCRFRHPDGHCEGGYWQWGGFERFFGFGRVEVADPAGGWRRHDFHNRHESLLNGRPQATWVYDGPPASGGNLHQASQHEWVERTSPVGVKFVTQVAGRQYRCFGRSQGEDLSPCQIQRTVHQVDEWGNPVQATLYGSDGVARSTQVQGREQHTDGWRLRPLSSQQYAGEQLNREHLLAETILLYDDARWSLPAVVRTWAGAGRYLDTARSYDGYGNPTSETVYNQYGTVTTLASAEGRTMTTAYDAHGLLPVAVTNPLGHTTTMSHDYRFQQPLSVTDANDATTTSHYDDFGRLVAVDLPLCPQAVLASYGDWAQPYYERLQQRIDDCGQGAAAAYSDLYVFYDSLGRKVQAQQAGDGNETILTSVAYDAKGRLVTGGVPYPIPGAPGQFRTPDWPGGATRTEYDALDRPVRVIAPDGAVTRSEYGQDRDGPTATLGALVRTFDALNHRKEQVSDEWGNLIRVREYSGGGVNEPPHALYSELVYSYDIQNRLVAVRDAAGNTTHLDYDELGRKTRMVDPDMGEWRYQYDPLGNLTSQTDALGVATQLRYDELNRLHKKWYVTPAGSAVLPTTGATYHYDQLPGGEAVPFGRGRRVQMDDPAGTVYYSYDAHGRVTSESRTFTGAYAHLANDRDNGIYHTHSTYNAAGWLRTLTYPDGDVVTTEYTRRGLPRRQWSSLGGELIAETSYNALGQPMMQLAGDGLKTTYDYYPAVRGNNRLMQIRVGEGELHLAYTYDKAGNLSALYDASQGVLGERIVYRYDHLDRLVAAKTEGGALAGYTLGYEYDAVGNMTGRTTAGQVTSYQYTGVQPHAVTAVGNDLYTYDANGNMVSRSEDGISYTQRWNPFNKLAQVRWQQEGHQCNVQFVYDGDGNRLLKIEGQGGLEITTYYAGQLFEKQFNTTARRLGETVPGGSGSTSFAACRGRGSGVTDYGFTGQRHETGFGLMDYNARYYSPRLGRFVSPDTIVPDPTTAKGFNRYLYGDGNPIRYLDPSGHFSEEQLVAWYGQNWQELFTDEWSHLLLDNPNSQLLGAQLGDLVLMGESPDHLTQSIFVLNPSGNLALWNPESKTSVEVASVGQTSPSLLGLYRIRGGETGSTGARYDYLTGGTQYLPATNGSGAGPFTMALLGQYSTGADLPATTLLSADWFFGNQSQGYYIHNYMASQHFDWWSALPGNVATGVSVFDVVKTFVRTRTTSFLGGVGTFGGLAYSVYSGAQYRPIYMMIPCSPIGGPAYCK